MRWVLVLMVAGLAGCAQLRAEREARDIAACENYGFRAGTDGMAQCRMQRARDRARAMDEPTPSLYRAPVNCYTSGAMTSCY